MVQQTPARLHLDKQIDVTRFVCFPSGYGSEDAYVSSAMLSRGADDFLAFRLQKLLYIHTLSPWPGLSNFSLALSSEGFLMISYVSTGVKSALESLFVKKRKIMVKY
jgi:hypothetical protein